MVRAWYGPRANPRDRGLLRLRFNVLYALGWYQLAPLVEVIVGQGTTSKIARAWRPARRGIFCLEDDWSSNMRERSSVEPLLHLLAESSYRVPYIHRNTATPETLEYYLRRWSQRAYRDFPILYLPVHGSPGGVMHFGAGRGRSELTLDELEDLLVGRCDGRIIFLASCDTLDVNGHRLNRFLRRTGALAVCGYKGYVDWFQSAAFDLLVLGAFQENAMTRAGARAMRARIARDACGLGSRLRFRMVIR